jgi:hypothetical protein
LDEIRLDRPVEIYQYLPSFRRLHGALARDAAVAGLTEQLRIFRKTTGLRWAPGARGMLKKIRDNGAVSYLSDDWDE